jgi:predicted PurR-regulated permease PerM
MKEPLKKYAAITWIVVLGAVLAYGLWSYKSAVFGALVFFVIFQPFYLYMRRKRIRKSWAAFIIILTSLLIVVIPSAFLVNLLVGEVSNISEYWDSLISASSNIEKLLPGIDLKPLLTQATDKFTDLLQAQLLGAIQGISHAAISIVIMYFILYYLFVNHNEIKGIAVTLIPFKKKNAQRLYQEFVNVTHSTVVATGIIALIQAGLLTIALFALGIKAPLLWGFVGLIMSFVPVVGISAVWIPASLFLFTQQRWVAGLVMLGWGLFISSVDNFIRPFIQRKVGSIHPLTSILGIFIGLPLFGLVGIVIGPLLLSYFLLTIDIFKKEYF